VGNEHASQQRQCGSPKISLARDVFHRQRSYTTQVSREKRKSMRSPLRHDVGPGRVCGRLLSLEVSLHNGNRDVPWSPRPVLVPRGARWHSASNNNSCPPS
jgi:hypothetical protein